MVLINELPEANAMISFQVDDMTCGHCVSKAVKTVDSGAKVQIDLATHRVEIEPTKADAVELTNAIKEAGYTPVAIERIANPGIAIAAPARKGCCCG
jgi:copper chaperone